MDQVAFITPLRRIAHPQGDIQHGMKMSDPGYAGFGEAYFTAIHHGQTKGWKKHTRMQLNLVVPVGEVLFFVHDEGSGRTTTFLLGDACYARLTVPPGLWVAFEGRGGGHNLVLNLANLEHDPAEALSAPLGAFTLEGDPCASS